MLSSCPSCTHIIFMHPCKQAAQTMAAAVSLAYHTHTHDLNHKPTFFQCAWPTEQLGKPNEGGTELARARAAGLHGSTLRPQLLFWRGKKRYTQRQGPCLTLAARAAEVEYKREDARDNMSGRDKTSGLRYPTLHVNSHSR